MNSTVYSSRLHGPYSYISCFFFQPGHLTQIYTVGWVIWGGGRGGEGMKSVAFFHIGVVEFFHNSSENACRYTDIQHAGVTCKRWGGGILDLYRAAFQYDSTSKNAVSSVTNPRTRSRKEWHRIQKSCREYLETLRCVVRVQCNILSGFLLTSFIGQFMLDTCVSRVSDACT